jgi:hypothetical protein
MDPTDPQHCSAGYVLGGKNDNAADLDPELSVSG